MKNLILLFTITLSTMNLFAGNVIAIYDTITFDKPYKYLSIDTSTQNIWTIGTPNKKIFNVAYEGSNSIVTGLKDNYPTNSKSFFDIYIGYFNYPGFYPDDMYFEFKHKYDTDSLKDGGYITVSYDKGKTWTNIINDSLYRMGPTPDWSSHTPSDSLYSKSDTLFNGEYGFSGKSKGWITTKFYWYVFKVKSTSISIEDTMIIRFNFISDNLQSNKEGWMIDNIRLYSEDLGSGIESTQGSFIKIFPNPTSDKVTITLDKVYSKIQLEILNLEGQSLKILNDYNKQNIDYSMQGFKQGIYMLKISGNDKLIRTSKLIKK